MNYLFLHGSWHGAWCWHKVLPLMHNEGHHAWAIDLPGRGRSPRLPALVGLQTMVRAAEASLIPDAKTTIVVHSRNGIVASMLAERRPDLIERVIYLAAFMLPNGKRVLDYLPDAGSLLTGKVEINRLALWDRLDPAAYREALYADCDPADVELARSLLTCEPLRPAVTRLTLTEARYGTVPKAYIRLTEDRAVSVGLQDKLLSQTPVDRVESLASSHSAYFSQPQKLAETILKLSVA